MDGEVVGVSHSLDWQFIESTGILLNFAIIDEDTSSLCRSTIWTNTFEEQAACRSEDAIKSYEGTETLKQTKLKINNKEMKDKLDEFWFFDH